MLAGSVRAMVPFAPGIFSDRGYMEWRAVDRLGSTFAARMLAVTTTVENYEPDNAVSRSACFGTESFSARGL
jgi:hypothetical protein